MGYIIRRFLDETAFAPYAFDSCPGSAFDLLAAHQSILLGDAQAEPRLLVENTASCTPWLWAVLDEHHRVRALACLDRLEPGRHAYLHGVMHPAMRRQPAINEVVDMALRAAFEEAGVLKVKAEFEADNPGAKGFCWRMGFRREARFEQDIVIQGVCKDVVVYSLTRLAWLKRRRATCHA